MPEVTIRLQLPGEEAAAKALWKSVGPYRPRDEAAVEAMYERANRAKERADPRWMAMPPRTDWTRRVGWVAVTPSGQGSEEVIGVVDLAAADGVAEMPSTVREALGWHLRDDVAEIVELSVKPAYWRQGIGSNLILAAIERARRDGYRLLVLNTTVPQAPAQNLYRKLGFSEVVRTFLDKYELVWFEMGL